MRAIWITWLIGALALTLTACGPDKKPQAEPPPVDDTAFQTSPEARLTWKRQGALVRDLARALSMDRDALCLELEQTSCAEVHEVPLGGNDPFELGLYEPVAEPLNTTPAVIDRMVLGACTNAVARDRQGQARVFTHIDLDADDLTGEEAAEGVSAQVVELYRRLLVRDPTDQEVALVAGLTADEAGAPRPGAEFAALACFAIGTTTEFIFQ